MFSTSRPIYIRWPRRVHDDTKTHDAVLRNLQTMGESTQRLSDPLKAAYPKVDWSELAAFRNVLVHNYMGMDLEQVWQIIQDDLPAFKQQIDAMIASMNPI